MIKLFALTTNSYARVVKLVDTRDLKSLDLTVVPVQVRPRVPLQINNSSKFTWLSAPEVRRHGLGGWRCPDRALLTRPRGGYANLLPYLYGETSGSPNEALYWRSRGQIVTRHGNWKLICYVAKIDEGELHHLDLRGEMTPPRP